MIRVGGKPAPAGFDIAGIALRGTRAGCARHHFRGRCRCGRRAGSAAPARPRRISPPRRGPRRQDRDRPPRSRAAPRPRQSPKSLAIQIAYRQSGQRKSSESLAVCAWSYRVSAPKVTAFRSQAGGGPADATPTFPDPDRGRATCGGVGRCRGRVDRRQVCVAGLLGAKGRQRPARKIIASLGGFLTFHGTCERPPRRRCGTTKIEPAAEFLAAAAMAGQRAARSAALSQTPKNSTRRPG